MDAKIFDALRAEIEKFFSVKSKVVYDHDDSMYYVCVFNTEVKRFDDVFCFVEDFYRQHENEFDHYIVPMVFTPAQTLDAYPEYADLPEVRSISKNNLIWVLSNVSGTESDFDVKNEDELALAA